MNMITLSQSSRDVYYDKNLIYERQDTGSGSGAGYSFDLGLSYALRQGMRAEVLWRDIGGRIYWKNIPYTTAEAISDVKEYDSDGYQIYRPTIRGYESYKNLTQKIPLKTDILFSYRQGSFTLIPLVNIIEDRPLYWLNLHYKAGKDLSLHTGYNTNYRAFTIGVAYKKVLLNISGSTTNLSRPAALGLGFFCRLEWRHLG